MPANNRLIFRDHMIDGWSNIPAAAKPLFKALLNGLQAAGGAAAATAAWLCHVTFGNMNNVNRGLCFEDHLALVLRYHLYPAGLFIHHAYGSPRDYTFSAWVNGVLMPCLGEAKLAHVFGHHHLARSDQDFGTAWALYAEAAFYVTVGEYNSWLALSDTERKRSKLFLGLWSEDGRILVFSKSIARMIDTMTNVVAAGAQWVNDEDSEPGCHGYTIRLDARIASHAPGPKPMAPVIVGQYTDALAARMLRPYQGSNWPTLAWPLDSTTEFIPTTGWALECILYWGTHGWDRETPVPQ